MDEDDDVIKLKDWRSLKPRVHIVTAVGCPPGHWFKCKNGHVYMTGNCGGAKEKSKCPEQAVIGGTNDNLDSTNSLASEMDGATHAPWSEATNNLLNAEELRWL
ncbi:LOW QUALITY PROTEIN: NFX1-type zinc finger-containing protein 1-like [Amazona ochrocephala]